MVAEMTESGIKTLKIPSLQKEADDSIHFTSFNPAPLTFDAGFQTWHDNIMKLGVLKKLNHLTVG